MILPLLSVSAVFFISSAVGPSADVLLQQLRAAPGVLSGEPVFQKGEQEFLIQHGEGSLATALRLTFQDFESYESLQKTVKVRHLGHLERNGRFQVNSNPEQWGLNNTGIPQQIEVTDILSRTVNAVTGEDVGVIHAPSEIAHRRIRVAVVDTGVDISHPALQAQIYHSPTECQALDAYQKCLRENADKSVCHQRYANQDTDQNGYPLDCTGWSALGGGDHEVSDSIGHGTHVAGIIGAQGLVDGVASQVEILPVQVMGKGETEAGAFADVVARGVLYAIRTHAQIINMSLGYSIHEDSELMRKMVALAQAEGILVVAAAGNESSSIPVYPCRYAGVICVASFSADGAISGFSDFGDAVDVAAPGEKILSTWPTLFFPSLFTERKGYDFKSGTSMAAPFVTGVLARLLNAGIQPAEAYARLLLGVRPHRQPTIPLNGDSKFTLSGNVDLSRSFAVDPQPLILPSNKEPVLLILDRMRGTALNEARFRLSLKNYWKTASSVQIQVSVSGEPQLTSQVDLWPQGENRDFEGVFRWAGTTLKELPGNFYFDVTVSDSLGEVHHFRKGAEFVVPVRPLRTEDSIAAMAGFERIMTDLGLADLSANYSIKPISCLSGGGQDLLLINKGERFTALRLLDHTETSSGIRMIQKQGIALLDTSKEQLFSVSCLDQRPFVPREFAISSFNAAEKKFAVTFYDDKFRRQNRLEWDAATAALAADFRWLSAADGKQWPAWIGRGRLPDSEIPSFDPWDKRPFEQRNPLESRLYYLSPSGLHTLVAPAGYRYVGFLKPTNPEFKNGSVRVLLLKGQDFVAEFSVAQLAAFKWEEPQSLSFEVYQRLSGLKSLSVFSMEGSLGDTAFIEDGAAGKMRLSLVLGSSSDASLQVKSWVLEAPQAGDWVSEVLGVFQGESAFFRSRFGLYFYDGLSRRAFASDLRQFDSVTRYLPAWRDGRPAVVLPEGQGSSLAAEVLVPTTQGLQRPALLKFFGVSDQQGSCEPIQMVSTGRDGAGGMPDQPINSLIYFCGDHFIRATL